MTDLELDMLCGATKESRSLSQRGYALMMRAYEDLLKAYWDLLVLGLERNGLPWLLITYKDFDSAEGRAYWRDMLERAVSHRAELARNGGHWEVKP
jgi:hypothetical protein